MVSICFLTVRHDLRNLFCRPCCMETAFHVLYEMWITSLIIVLHNVSRFITFNCSYWCIQWIPDPVWTGSKGQFSESSGIQSGFNWYYYNGHRPMIFVCILYWNFCMLAVNLCTNYIMFTIFVFGCMLIIVVQSLLMNHVSLIFSGLVGGSC